MSKEEPKPDDVIIGQEVLTGLPLFRHLVCTMYAEWARDQDPSIVKFIDSLDQMFLEPLVNFDAAYELFNSYCSNKEHANIVGDHWRVFQMMVYTELDEGREKIFADFASMVRRIMGDSPGGKDLFLRKLVAGNVTPTDGPKSVTVGMDYIILLALRVYIGGIRGINAPTPDKK